jgi:2-dehydro-3-deoxyphosphogluconate aldolase/(4S)-4-hydroxy-2-oxoglutarate aldolase
MGSKLFPKDVIAAENWSAIAEKCREALAIIAATRK